MFVLTAMYFLVEIVVGYVTNSMALVADSFHMLSDVAALVVAYLSVKVNELSVYLNIYITVWIGDWELQYSVIQREGCSLKYRVGF